MSNTNHKLISYDKKPIAIDDFVQNIESGWVGKVVDVELIQDDLMLVCHGVYWWTGELDPDDKQWHSASDVIRRDRSVQQPLNASTVTPGLGL